MKQYYRIKATPGHKPEPLSPRECAALEASIRRPARRNPLTEAIAAREAARRKAAAAPPKPTAGPVAGPELGPEFGRFATKEEWVRNYRLKFKTTLSDALDAYQKFMGRPSPGGPF